MPTVSVVMPTYNRAHLIQPVIHSILDQDYQDLELLIVDDGSSDNTEDLISELSQQDTRLQYLRLSQNCGIGCARDAGLNHVKDHSKYIALADSDDLWIANRLGQQVDILERYPKIDILFGDFDNVNHIQGTRASGMQESKIGLKFLKLEQLEESLYFIESGIERGILVSNFIAAPTILMRSAAIDVMGGFMGQLRNPDLEFAWRGAVLGVRFAYIDKYLIERHLVADSNTAQGVKPLIQRLNALEVCRKTVQNLSNRQTLESYIKKAENQTYIKIIHYYGKNSKRKEIVQTLLKSFKYGINFRIFTIAAVGLLGPFAVNFLYAILRLIKKVRENGFRATL